MKALLILGALLAGAGLACSSGNGSDDPASTATPPSAAAPAATSTPAESSAGADATPTVTTPPDAAISVSGDGVVVIDWSKLKAKPFFSPPRAGSADPFYFIHTDPAADGFFLSIEAYTTAYGRTWTGQLGTFAIDCSTAGTGICVHFDPDGPGPMPPAGSNFDVRGSITFERLDATGYTVILTNVVFSEGFTIPGPLRLSSSP